MPTGQTVERLAGEILLNDLALEGDAMGSVGSVLELLSKVDGAVKSQFLMRVGWIIIVHVYFTRPTDWGIV